MKRPSCSRFDATIRRGADPIGPLLLSAEGLEQLVQVIDEIGGIMIVTADRANADCAPPQCELGHLYVTLVSKDGSQKAGPFSLNDGARPEGGGGARRAGRAVVGAAVG